MKVENAKKAKVVEFLKTIPSCSKLPKSMLSKFYYGMELVQFQHGQRIIREDELVEYVYFIKDGDFEMFKEVVLNDQEENQRVIENEIIRNLILKPKSIQNNINLRRKREDISSLSVFFSFFLLLSPFLSLCFFASTSLFCVFSSLLFCLFSLVTSKLSVSFVAVE